MSSAAELVRVALLALVAGVALPVLVQLFVTVRGLQRSASRLEAKLDQALAAAEEALSAQGRKAAAVDPLAALVGAVAPALIAGLRAYHGAGAAADHQQRNDEKGEHA